MERYSSSNTLEPKPTLARVEHVAIVAMGAGAAVVLHPLRINGDGYPSPAD